MNPTPDSTLDDPQQVIADLKRQFAESNAERDKAQQQLIERTVERDEALEQQTATAEVLQVINSSPGDLTPVFDAMLEKALRLCDASFGVLFIRDRSLFRLVATRNLPSRLEGVLAEPFEPSPGGFLQQAIGGEAFEHIADLRAATSRASQDPRAKAIVELGDARTVLSVALCKDHAVWGFFAIYRTEVRPFTDKQIALVQNFAAQAVIAMENARLITETREALEQQTATAEVLGVINSSPGDLAPVFDAMLEKAMRLCGAAFGTLQTFDGERWYGAAASTGVPLAFTEFRKNNPPPYGPGTISDRILKGEPLVHTVDLKAEDLYRSGDPNRRALVDLAGARSSLVVPLLKDRAVLGVIQIFRKHVQPFSDKQIALLQNFAAQAVIAMENARLITETREALEQQTATAEVLGVINSSPGDLVPVFDAILEKARSLCGAVHGALVVYDGEHFRAVATHGLPEPLEGLLRTPFRPNPVHQALLRGERLIHIADQAAVETDTSIGRASVDAGARTLLLVPLRKDGAFLGYITASHWEVRPFSDKEIALLENFAAQAVIAMENARLITETREALEQQTATAEVLGVINASPGDLTPVFEAILEKALNLCEAACGHLYRYDGEFLHPMAMRGEAKYIEFLRQRGAARLPEGSPTPIMRVISSGEYVQVPDCREDEGYRLSERFRAQADAGGWRSALCVPLRKDAAVVGTITVFRQEVQPFTEKQIALLQNFAAQAVIATENARLLGELRQRTDDLTESLEYQTATSDVLKVISQSGTELGQVLQTLVEKAAQICESDSAVIVRQEDGHYSLAASLGLSAEWAEFAARHPIEANRASVTGRSILERRVVHVEDVTADPEYDWGTSQRLGGFRTSISVPLLRDDKLIGAISLSRARVEPFTDKQIALIASFADQAVIAIENARLFNELRASTDQVAGLNRDLEARVAEQVDELGRVGRLKRFLAPQLAELIVSQGDEKILESHRREIVVVFCDLRGYTAFTETAEPEEVLDFLREYHGGLGPLVSQFEGTLDQFSGDGIMVFFNDPVPCADPAERAVKMAMAMRSAANTLIADWRERGRDLGFGAGIAQGYATLGQIGFSERSGYTAIGTVCNVAARLCAEAKDGQILLGQRVNVALKGSVATEQLGALTLKGLSQPVVAYNVPLGAIQPALRVIEGGSPETD